MAELSVVYLHPLGTVQLPNITDIPDDWYMCNNDVLGGFNYLLQSLPVIGQAQTMPVRMIFKVQSFRHFLCQSKRVLTMKVFCGGYSQEPTLVNLLQLS